VTFDYRVYTSDEEKGRQAYVQLCGAMK